MSHSMGAREVVVVGEIEDQVPEWPVERDPPTEELARRLGVTPVTSLQDLQSLAHPQLWDSEEDLSRLPRRATPRPHPSVPDGPSRSIKWLSRPMIWRTPSSIRPNRSP